MARKAFLTALSGKVKDNELLVLNELKLAAPKTKEMAKIMKNFPQIKNGLLISSKDEIIKKAARNLPNLNIASIDNLNIADLLKHKYLIFTENGIGQLNKKYAAAK